MIIKELAELSMREGFVQDIDLEKKGISFAIDLSKEGRFLGLIRLEGKKILKKDGTEVVSPKEMLVPRMSETTSGIESSFLAGKSKYVFGKTAKDEEETKKKDGKELDSKTDQKRDSFRALVEEAYKETGDDSLGAVVKFLSDPKALEAVWKEAEERVKSSNLFTFQVADEVVFDRPGVRRWWKGKCEKKRQDGPQGICPLSGRNGPLLLLHPKISGLMGTPLPLVSSQMESARSSTQYDRGATPVNFEIGIHYATALEELLRDDNSKVGLGGKRVAVFWPRIKVVGALKDDSKTLKEAIQSVRYGPNRSMIDDPSEFRMLFLYRQLGRVSIQSCHRMSVGEAVRNVLSFQKEASLGEEGNFHPIWAMIEAVAIRHKRGDAYYGFEEDLFRSALFGWPIPAAVYQLAIDAYPKILREEAEEKKKKKGKGGKASRYLRQCLGLLSIAMNRCTFIKSLGGGLKMGEPSGDVGFVLGQIFAELEGLQYQAHDGKIRSPISITSFYGAMRVPEGIFPDLFQLSMAHRNKLMSANRAGIVVNADKAIGELLGKIPRGAFPKKLNAREQGAFIFGYNFQRQLHFERARKAKEAKAGSEATLGEGPKSQEVPV